MKIKAYAKLNLALNIVKKRADGMHELDMIMQNISLYDEIDLQKSETLCISFEKLRVGENNTVSKAAQLFFDATKIKGRAIVKVVKHIPSQAGLGGGSSDGAAVLNGLNRLYDAKLNVQELKSLGIKIGADVPFFIEGGCMRAQGIGERLFPIKNECDFSYLLVKPKEGISTALAYQKYHELPVEKVNMDAVAEALSTANFQKYFENAKNSLSNAGIALCPKVQQYLDECYTLGAKFAMMTGSGSCIFAIFKEKHTLQKAYECFKNQSVYCEIVHNERAGYTMP
ncbi:MAG: 4-(cytidine 5'-diphospho)-2-C-methyl-D-erythritol kinase [Christensenellaceae bacterium]